MEDTYYILLLDNKINKETQETDVMLFSNLELAQQKLLELKDNFMREIKNDIDNYAIEDNSDDEFLASFSAYENGFYDENHFELTIYQRELN